MTPGTGWKCAPWGAAAPLLAACFSPTGVQHDTAESSTTASSASTTTSTTGPTAEPTTGGSTSESTTATTTTTGGDCGVCPTEAPVCDEATLVCRPCLEHAECPETACELDVGRCFPKDMTSVSYVAPTCVQSASCSKDDPCCSIAQALTASNSTGQPYRVFRVGAGIYGGENFTMDLRIAILGADKEAVSFVQKAVPALRVEAGKLFVADVTISESGELIVPSVLCDSAEHLWIDDAAIRSAPGIGVESAGTCPVTVRRSTVLDTNKGFKMAKGKLTLLNTIVGDATLYTIDLEGPGGLEAVYSTVTSQNSTVLACSGSPSILIRNSAFLAAPEASGSVNCATGDAFDVSYSAISNMELAGTANAWIDPTDVPKLFVGWATGNYLAADGGLKAIALWRDGDPATDIDGDLRPTADQTPDYAGADVHSP